MNQAYYYKQQIEKLKKQIEELKNPNKGYYTYSDEDGEICDKEFFKIEEEGVLMPIEKIPVDSEEEWEALYEERSEALIAKMIEYKLEFPKHVFPKYIADHVIDAQKCLNYPSSYYLAGILMAFSTAVGANFRAELMPGKEATALLMMAIVGHPNINKSSPFSAALQPLKLYEQEMAIKYKEELKAYEALSTDERRNTTEPKETRCIAGHFTMEAVLRLAEQNRRGIAALADELAGTLKGMNMYRKGNDEELWLEIFSDKGLRMDRVDKQIVIPNVFINMAGTIQTEVILDFIQNSSANNGFFDRILYVCPDEDCDMKWRNTRLDIELRQKYYDLVNTIFKVPVKYDAYGNLIPKMFSLTLGATETMIKWQNNNDDFCNNINNRQIIGVAKKLEIYLGRFALILAIVDYADKCPALLNSDNKLIIAKKHMEGAIALCDYFLNSARSLMILTPTKTNIGKANATLLRFHDALENEFDLQDAYKVAAKLKISVRTMFNFLRSDYFKKVERGYYAKRHYKK